MPIVLAPLPADLKPPPDEIRKEAASGRARGLRPDIAEQLALIEWKVEGQRRDPDAFLVPFVEDVGRYNDYRRSVTWHRIRRAKLDEAGGVCQGCGGKATQVHHRDYRSRVLRGEDGNALVALCRTCHEHIHSKMGGKVPSWQEQERRLFVLTGVFNVVLNH